MTCIVGLIENKRIHIGGDSLATTGSLAQTMKDPKVFQVGNACLMGYSGTVRMSNLLKYALVLPEHPAEMSTECYLSTLFVDAIRSLLKNSGVSSKRDEQEMSTGDILVAYRNQLFKIGYDYCVMEAVDGFDAIGSGNEIALGVMHATRYLEVKPLARIQLALEAAEWLNNGVRGPFTVGTLQDAQVTLGEE